MRGPIRAAVLAAFLVNTAAAATAGPEAYGCVKPIRLGYNEFGNLYHEGTGIDPDIIAEIIKRTGCVFEASSRPRSEIWLQLEIGTLDMTNGAIRTDARRKFAYFIPYLGWRNILVTRHDVAAREKTVDSFVADRTVKFGVVGAYVLGPYYDFRLQEIAGTRVIQYPDQDAVFAALRKGEVQAIVSPGINYDYYIRAQEDRSAFVRVDVPDAPVIPHSMIFSVRRFSDAEINNWQRLFDAMRSDGTLARIYHDHLPPETADAILHY
jgi:polar amino acid transport system substrate-binding protein